MATVKQNNEFKKFLSDNSVNKEDLTRDDAKEFLSSGTVKRFTAPSNEPEVTGKELGKEIFEGVDLNPVTPEPIPTEQVKAEDVVTPVEEPKVEPTPTPEVTPPTEEQKQDFPKGTFDGPSPVTVDQEGKLSTGVTPLEVEPSTQETYAINNNLPFERGSKNQIMFQPKNLDEAMDLYSTFGPNVSIDKTSSAAIRGSKVYQEYSKYKGADKATLTQAFKNNDLGVGGETWDRLVKMNGGEATFEMLEAKKDYELSLKTNNINDLSNITQGQTPEPTQTAITTQIDALDKAYTDKINSLFEGMGDNWATYKEGSEVTRELNTSITDRSGKIDELNVAKRDILKDIQKQHPNLPYGNQLSIASQQMADIDDQLFVLQREQNIDISKLNYETTQLKGDYEFQVQQDNAKLELINSMYSTARGDLKDQAGFERADTIREQGFERADRITADKIAREDKQIEDQLKAAVEAKKQAVIDGDATLAKKYAYDIALLQEKEKLNKSAKDSIITLGGDAYLEYNTETGGWDQKTTTKEEVTNTTPISTGTNKITQNYGAISPVTVDNVKLADGTIGTPGVDLDGKLGDPISAFTGGTVKIVDTVGGFGNRVVIEDENGNLHAYNHLQSANVSEGDIITKGQTIAAMGNSGTVIKGEGGDGSHLDYRVSDNGKVNLSGGNWINPNQFIGGDTTVAPSFSTNRLARNTAIDLFLGADEIKLTTKARLGADLDLVDKFGTQIDQFREENLDLVRKFEAVTGESSKTSDKEQVKNFNRAIGEAAMGDGDLTPMKMQIRNAILDDKAIFSQLAPAIDVQEQIEAIQDLFSGLDVNTGLTTAAGNKIAKTVGDEIGDGTITSIDQLTGKMLAAYVKSISGVAVSEPEYQRLSAQLPQLKDNPKRFERMLENFRKTTIKSGTVMARTKLNDDDLFNELFDEFKLDTATLSPQDEEFNSYKKNTSPVTPNTNRFNNFIKKP